MPDVMEDTIVHLDGDLNDEAPCATNMHADSPPRATWVGVLPCKCNALLCDLCMHIWRAVLNTYSPSQKSGCGKCGAHFVVADVEFMPIKH